MAETTIYVRNMRPNRVIIKYASLREVLERRGSREDSVSLPAEAKNDPVIARWLSAGMIEEISKDEFLTLTASLDAFEPDRRDEREPAIRNSLKARDLPIVKTDDEGNRTPTVVDTNKIDRDLLRPSIEYVNPPQKKAEVSDNLAPQEVDLSDYHRGETGRPEQLTGREHLELEAKLAEAQAELERLREAQKAEKPATKRKTSTRKSTKKS